MRRTTMREELSRPPRALPALLMADSLEEPVPEDVPVPLEDLVPRKKKKRHPRRRLTAQAHCWLELFAGLGIHTVIMLLLAVLVDPEPLLLYIMLPVSGMMFTWMAWTEMDDESNYIKWFTFVLVLCWPLAMLAWLAGLLHDKLAKIEWYEEVPNDDSEG